MSKLLTNTPETKKATAMEKMADVLDMIEANFLSGNRREQTVIKHFGFHKDIIDISSATSMNLFHETTEKRLVNALQKKSAVFLEQFHSYPYLIQKNFDLENAFSDFIKRWTKIQIKIEEIMIAPNGVYGSYKTILLSQPEKYVIVPELIHQINKACFTSLGKKVCEVPIILETGLFDLDALDQALKHHSRDVACVYIYHTRAVQPPSREYYLKLASLLKKHGVLGVIDLDSWYTSYTAKVKPWLPLAIPELRKECLFLFTLTKEIGAPGLRVGFVVGQKKNIENLKRFKSISLEMDSPVTRFLTLLILPKIDMQRAEKALQKRMHVLTDGLQSLGFKVTVPPSGVNFFLHVPESFATSKRILPDHLFTYYILLKTHVLLRPASNHGHRLNHWVRFVLGQPEKNIREVLKRMKKAGMRGDMKMPEKLESEYEEFIRAFR